MPVRVTGFMMHFTFPFITSDLIPVLWCRMHLLQDASVTEYLEKSITKSLNIVKIKCSPWVKWGTTAPVPSRIRFMWETIGNDFGSVTAAYRHSYSTITFQKRVICPNTACYYISFPMTFFKFQNQINDVQFVPKIKTCVSLLIFTHFSKTLVAR